MIYEFNKYGVCLNPTVILEKETKQYSVRLTVAQAPSGKWDYGYMLHIKFGHMGYSAGGANDLGKYDTMEAAKKSAIDWYTDALEKGLKQAKEWNGRLYDVQSKPKPKSDQLKLFK